MLAYKKKDPAAAVESTPGMCSHNIHIAGVDSVIDL